MLLARFIFLCALFGFAPNALCTEVAVTVDDLPTTGSVPKGVSRAQIVDDMLRVLKKFDVPEVYGFVNAGQLDDMPEFNAFLKKWVDAGYPLGNHTFSHMDAHKNSVADFMKDVERNEKVLERESHGKDFHYLRYPHLHEGETLEKRESIRKALKAKGYRIAESTIFFEDWIWNEAYPRCAGKGNTAEIKKLEKKFIDSGLAHFKWAKGVSRWIFGHEIPQILVLHVGVFDARMLEKLLESYKKAGVKFIGLQQALTDQAYRAPSNESWDEWMLFLFREARSRKIDIPPVPALPMEYLEKVCAG